MDYKNIIDSEFNRLELSVGKDRIKFIKTLELFFIKELRNIGCHLSKYAVCVLREDYLEIGINKETRKGYRYEFGSEFKIYMIDGKRISISASASFNPKTKRNSISSWKIVQASEIIKKFDKVEVLIDSYYEYFNKLY